LGGDVKRRGDMVMGGDKEIGKKTWY
jgi:hypothetical protein